MESLLRANFPTYKIYNASNKTDKHREQTIQLCMKEHNILMYVVRNKKNDQFFKKYEKLHYDKKLQLLFFNKDDYIYFRENPNADYKGLMIFLKHRLNMGDNECCICYETFQNNNLIICQKCGSSVCRKCILLYLAKSNKQNMDCPVCKSCVLACVLRY